MVGYGKVCADDESIPVWSVVLPIACSVRPASATVCEVVPTFVTVIGVVIVLPGAPCRFS